MARPDGADSKLKPETWVALAISVWFFWRNILPGSLVSTHSTYARAEISRETSTGLASLEGRYLYGEQNSVRNTDKFEFAFTE